MDDYPTNLIHNFTIKINKCFFLLKEFNMKFVTNSTAHDVAVSLDWVRSITLHSLSKNF
jgi:hypothetical protein